MYLRRTKRKNKDASVVEYFQLAHNERDPAVSPDGRFIVYVAEDNQYQRLMVRSLDGSGDRRLLSSGDGLLPVW